MAALIVFGRPFNLPQDPKRRPIVKMFKSMVRLGTYVRPLIFAINNHLQVEGIDILGPLVGRFQYLPGVNASRHFEKVHVLRLN
jgi:hypothetical protein